MKKALLLILILGAYSIELQANGNNSVNPQGTTLKSEMEATNQGTVENKGTIISSSSESMLAKGNNSKAINSGTIASTLMGMRSEDGGESINKGIISSRGTGMKAFGGKIINQGIIQDSITAGMDASFSSVNQPKSIAINRGIIQTHSDKGMIVFGGSNGINEGIIRNDKDMGIWIDGKGSTGNNSKTGFIANGGDYGMKATNGGIATNNGMINNGGNYKMYADKNSTVINNGTLTKINNNQIGLYAVGAESARNNGTIEVIKGIGVKIDEGNFYNTGTINAVGQTAIEMDDRDSILELGSGTKLRGTTDGLKGEDTLVLSGTGNIDVGNHSIHNFEKLVVTGDITAQGTYHLGVSNGSGYKTSAFGNSKTYNLDDVSGAPGNLNVDGTINVDVNYDNIDSNGTDKTGKIIANTISKTNNGHIILVNGGKSSLNIIDEAKKNNINSFRIKNIATVSGAQVIDPTLFETNGDTKAINGWKSITTGDRAGINGSILLDQRYYKGSLTLQPVTTSTQKTPGLKPKQPIQVPQMALVPQKTPTLQPVTLKNSKIIIPRNKVDLDSMNRLTKITNDLTSLDFQPLKKGEDKFTVNYLGAKGNGDFKGSKAYNYDYNTTSNGVAIAYMYQLTSDFSIGTGLSYEDSNVKYNGVTLNNNIKIKAPTNHHKENIKTYNSQIFAKYKINNFNLNMGLGYGLSTHDLTTNFVDGMKNGDYNSRVLKTGLEGSYNYRLVNNYELVPSLGVDYIHVSEDSYKYDNSAINLESASSSGFVSTLGLKLRKKVNKFKWSLGGGYKYSSTASYHDTRKVSGYPLEVEKLHSDKGLIFAGGNIQYDVNNDFSITSGYEHEVNKNYSNDNINIGFTYKFNSVKDFIPNIPQKSIAATDQINNVQKNKINKSKLVKKEKIINLSKQDTMEFKINDYKLTKTSSEKVKEIARKLEKESGVLIIEGHTDNTGTKKYNQKLSENRAENVKNKLEKELKNQDLKLVSKGVGEEFPIYPNTTQENREKNRAVLFKFKDSK